MRDYKFRQHDLPSRRRLAAWRRLVRPLLILLALGCFGAAAWLYFHQPASGPATAATPAYPADARIIPLAIPPGGASAVQDTR